MFAYFTDPVKFVTWMGIDAELDPRPGGRFRIDAGGGNIARGEYLSVEPPIKLVFTWGWENSEVVPPGSTTVEITLSADGQGTLIQLRHIGLPTHESKETHHSGWNLYTARLRASFEGSVDP